MLCVYYSFNVLFPWVLAMVEFEYICNNCAPIPIQSSWNYTCMLVIHISVSMITFGKMCNFLKTSFHREGVIIFVHTKYIFYK